MWETVISVVVKYWVEFILAGVVGVFTYLVKRYIKLSNEERKRGQQDFYKKLQEDIKNDNKAMANDIEAKHNELSQQVAKQLEEERVRSRADDSVLQDQINKVSLEVSALKAGMLSVQGKEFKNECRRLLNGNHIITLDEWEELCSDHEAYNGLGGNHRGDELFELVRKKMEAYLLKKKDEKEEKD